MHAFINECRHAMLIGQFHLFATLWTPVYFIKATELIVKFFHRRIAHHSHFP